MHLDVVIFLVFGESYLLMKYIQTDWKYSYNIESALVFLLLVDSRDIS
jgi:hypothetical protein